MERRPALATKSAELSTTVIKALVLLEIVADSSQSLSLSEIASRASFDRSTAYRLLNTLVEAGYLLRDDTSRHYRLSYRLVALSRNLLADNEVSRMTLQVLERIAAETGESVHFSALDGMQTVLIQKVKGTQLVAVDFQLGDRSMLHCTSIGKAVLAFQDAPFVEKVIAAGLPALASRTITDADALRQELARVCANGYALDDHEFSDNMRCIAVPVFGSDGRVSSGISISGPDSRFNFEKLEELKTPLLAGAREISRRMGGRSGDTTG
jgi:IclR family transcriptional regulator, KDG regulon repressor